MTGAGQPDTRAIMVTFTADELARLIHADHLAETGDLAEFTRRAAMDKVGLIERLAEHGSVAGGAA